MSEQINIGDNRAAIRWKLLTSASAFVLAAAVSSMNAAMAEDADRPQIWIDLGGQMESIGGQGEIFAPAFLSKYSTSSVLWDGVTPLQAQKPSTFGFGEDGSISFQPENSNWVFSAGIRYGRSSNSRHVQHQTSKTHAAKYTNGVPQPTSVGNHFTFENFSDTKAQRRENYAILDFSAGKDVGLGMFGRNSSSVLSLGVRFAQFTSSETLDIRARPDLQFKYANLGPFGAPAYTLVFPYFHTYHVTGEASRSFRGVGPSLSWSGSSPFAGNPQNGEITFDWGANAAVLFGRQKAHVRHHETAHYRSWARALQYSTPYTVVYHHPSAGHPTFGHDTDRSVTVPNVGGFAGISFRYDAAKISFGYRADIFFGAMDTGIDTAKKSNLTFNGPFASISIGLGD